MAGSLVLIPASRKDSTTGYKGVSYHRSEKKLKKFEAKVQADGKSVFLGYFETAKEAATAYARSEYGRADAAKLLQPRATPTAAGAEAIRQAESEGLTLATSGSNSTGYKGVCYCPKRRGSKKYQLRVTVGGKKVFLGSFATAELAALFYARREAGRDTSDLTVAAPPPPPAPSTAAGAEAVRQAEREGLTLATSSSSNSGYKGVFFCPKRQGSKKYQLRVRGGGKQATLGFFATAEEAALARARHLWDTTVRLLEPQPQQAPPQGAAGPSEASSVEEEDGFDPADIADAVAFSAEAEGLRLHLSSSNRTGYRGVCEHHSGHFMARLVVDGRYCSSGSFGTAVEAAAAYARAVGQGGAGGEGLTPASRGKGTKRRRELGCFCDTDRHLPTNNLPFEGVWISCDACGRWCHGECAGVDKQQAEEAEEYTTCPLCAAADQSAGASSDGGSPLIVAAVVSDGDGSDDDDSADGAEWVDAEVVEMAFDGTNAVGSGRSSGEPSGGSDFLIAPGRARPPPPPAGWVWPREGGVIEVEVEEGQPAAWLRATVTAVLEDGWFQALVRTPSDEGWHDWFSWREEGTDWRRVPPRQDAAAEPSSSSVAAAEPEAAEPEAAEPEAAEPAEPSAASQRGGAIEAAPAGPAPWSRAEAQHLSEAIRESMPAIHARFAAKEGGSTARSAEELMGRFVAAARWQRAEAAAR